MKQIYLDYAASTPVDSDVVKAMIPYFSETYGNPSSTHKHGRTAREAVEHARKQVSSCFNVDPETILFTSGGTEADNLALKGILFQHLPKDLGKGPHIITSEIEHPAVLQTCKQLEEYGYSIAYLPVDNTGLVNLDLLEKTIAEDTKLISIMYANNEIGTIEPVEKIGKIAHKHNVLFHTDAVQAVGKVPIDLSKLPIDLLSLSSHKIYGPKGVGALYHTKEITFDPLLQGGGHEWGKRSGTLNTPGIIGLGKACELSKQRLSNDITHLQKMRDYFIEKLNEIESSTLNGHPTKRLVNNIHFRFEGIEGNALHSMLDEKGISIATGSACSSEKIHASHVLLALGLSPEDAISSIRFTIGRNTKKEEIDYVLPIVKESINHLRSISPLWEQNE
jgi:cysteine desulfurase